MNETVIILRGTSGCGKSTFANFLQSSYPEAEICTADDYMFENGEYKFDVSKLGFAHKSCQLKFNKAIDYRTPLIVVANTSAKSKDFQYYLDKGREKGYIVHVVVLERYHEGVNQHNVPIETLEHQEQNIRDSLKLR